MSEEKSLQVVEQKTVVFYGDEVVAVRVQDGSVYIPIRPICDLLGVNWSGQAKKLRDDPVLSDASMSVWISTQTSGDNRRPKNSRMIALPLDYLNGWLFGINANRVKESVRESVIRYQKECYRVLYEAFQTGEIKIHSDDSDINDLLQNAAPETAEAYQIARAVYQMARRQLVTEARLNDHESRLQLLEARAGDSTRHIDAKQASMISQAVKALAFEMGKRSGRSEFGNVYGELYRRYEIAEYRELPAVRFDEAMQFLNQWHSSLTGKELPF